MKRVVEYQRGVGDPPPNFHLLVVEVWVGVEVEVGVSLLVVDFSVSCPFWSAVKGVEYWKGVGDPPPNFHHPGVRLAVVQPC